MSEEKTNLISAFSKLDVTDKRKELGRELSESTILIYKLLADITSDAIQPDIDNFNNLYDNKLSEDDYLTGLYEDFIDYQELLSIYLDKVLKDKYE